MAITLDGTNGITTPAIDLTVTPLPVDDGGTGITSFGSGIATFLQTPSSANLASAITNETGSGSLVFGTSPTLTTPTIDSAQVPTVSGTAPLYLCRAWVNFNGTGTVAIRASGNVTSITDNGVGDYTINFTTAMPDANYAAALACQYAEGTYTAQNIIAAMSDGTGNQAAGSLRVRAYVSSANTSYDVVRYWASIFR